MKTTANSKNRFLAWMVLAIFMFDLAPFPVMARAESVAPIAVPAPSVAGGTTKSEPKSQAVGRAEPAAAPAAAPARGEPVAAVQSVVVASAESEITREGGGTIRLGEMSLEIPPGAVENSLKVRIETLAEVATLNAGLENATVGVKGYRALPHGTQFKEFVKITVPYDRAKVDTEAKREGLATYFYDESRRVWVKLERVGIDAEHGTITSVTSHFTDFISATLKSPDSPKPLGFNPTSIKDIKAADPSAEVPKVEGLEGGQTGAASFQIGLRLPKGRGGVGPELALSYNSSGSSGWLGQGFDLSVPSISIDTRHHLPRFDGNDTYTLGGQELVETGRSGEVVHYRPRIESGFSAIDRKKAPGGMGHQYIWEVRDKGGRVTTFGGAPDAVMGPDFQWLVSSISDADGNWMYYEYSLPDSATEHRYLKKIVYTLHGPDGGDRVALAGRQAHYEVVFSNEDRGDRRVDMRGGFKNRLNQRLREITVQYASPGKAATVIRSYELNYTMTVFGKSQLAWYREKDDAGKEFYRYAFTYKQVKTAGSKILGLEDQKPWSGSMQETFSASINGGGSLSGGVTLYFPMEVLSVDVGVNVTGGSSSSYENTTMLDLNGDGIVDVLQHNMKAKKIFLGRGDGKYDEVDQSGFPQGLWDWINGVSSLQTNLDLGANGKIALFTYPVASAAVTHGTSNTQTKWTYMDIDGDGKVDIIKPGDSNYYRNTSQGRQVSFALSPLHGSSGASRVTLPEESILKKSHLLDPLRMWMARWSGVVDYKASVTANGKDDSWDGVQARAFTVNGQGEAQRLGMPIDLSSANDTGRFEKSGWSVGVGDHVVMQQNSKLLSKDDAVAWQASIRYQRVKLFAEMTNPHYVMLPQAYTLSGADSNRDRDVLSQTYDEPTQPSQDGTKTWTRKPGVAANAAVNAYFMDRGYYIYQKMSQETWLYYCSREYAELTTAQSGLLPVFENYAYEPLSGQMVLKSGVNYATMQQIFQKMQAYGFQPAAVQTIPSLESVSSRDMTSGKVVTVSQQEVASHNVQGKVGFIDTSEASVNARVLVEKINHAGGGTTLVYLRPYYTDGLHVEVQSSGKITTSAQEDLWIDGSTKLHISLQGSGSSTCFVVTGDWPNHDQQKSFRLPYQAYENVSSAEVSHQLAGRILRSNLGSEEVASLRLAMEKAISAELQQRVRGSYKTQGTALALDPNITQADKGLVLWALALSGKVALPTQKASSLKARLAANLSTTRSGFSVDTTAGMALVLWLDILSGKVTVPGISARFTSEDYWDSVAGQAISVSAFYDNHPALIGNQLTTYEHTAIINSIDGYSLACRPGSSDYRDITDADGEVSLSQDGALARFGAQLPQTMTTAAMGELLAAVDGAKANLEVALARKARLAGMLEPDAEVAQGSKLIQAASAADREFLVLWELYAGVVTIPYLTVAADAKSFGVDQNQVTNPAMLFYLPAYNLFDFLSVVERIDCNSETTFAVQQVEANGSIVEYGYGTKVAQGRADAVCLSHFEGSGANGATVENWIYVHGYDSVADFSVTDIRSAIQAPAAGQSAKISIPNGTLLTCYAGGNFGWFYADWDSYAPNLGVREYKESLIANQMAILNDREESTVNRLNGNHSDDPQLKDSDMNNGTDARRDCQVIWPMAHNEGIRPNAWHGAVNSRQETVWNGTATVTRVSFDSSYQEASITRSYRLGGDDPLNSSPATIEPGSGLSWVRQSSGSMDTYNIGLLGFLNTAYSKGVSSGDYDLIDMNGDRFPDMVRKANGELEVYENLGERPPIGSNAAPGIEFSTTKEGWGGVPLREYKNAGLSISASISPGSSQTTRAVLTPGGKAKEVSLESSGSSDSNKISVDVGLGINVGSSYKQSDLIDLNGDGLPDLVRRSGNSLSISLNTGHGFGAAMTMAMDGSTSAMLDAAINARYANLSLPSDLRDSVVGAATNSLLSFSGNTSVSFNIGAGGGVAGIGLHAGIGISVATDRGYFDMMDLNGDGLPDMVIRSGKKLFVCFNQGDQFMPPQEWGSAALVGFSLNDLSVYNTQNNTKESHNEKLAEIQNDSRIESPLEIDEEISSSTTLGFSVNGGLSVGVPFLILAWYIPPFGPPGALQGRVGLGLSIGGGINTTSIETSYADVDGDGLPDHIMKTSTGTMVRFNQTGQDGLLTGIALPQGGAIELEYQRSENTSDDANSRYLLCAVRRSNWDTARKPDASLPTTSVAVHYSYAGGYYDRNDRSFWGYQTVTSSRMQDEASDSWISQTVTTYNNRDYFLKDKPVVVETSDQTGVIQRQENLMTAVHIAGNLSTWVRMDGTVTTRYDHALSLTNETSYGNYDDFGNPTLIKEYLNGHLRNTVTIQYQGDVAGGDPHVASLPTGIVVAGADGKLLRKREGSYDARGRLTEQRSFWDSGSHLSTQYDYDDYGNITQEQDDAGYTLNYSYDPDVHQQMTSVSDSLRQSNAWTYNNTYTLQLGQTDVNDQTISKTYDSFERLETVRSPYDQGTTPALRFQYDHSALPWKAITANKVNYAPNDDQTITTVIIADGMGQVLQTKKQTVVTDAASKQKTEGWAVSPWVVLDSLGREWQKGTPAFEAGLVNPGLYAAVVRSRFQDGDLYSENTYDSQDRVTDVRLPDATHQKTDYRLGQWLDTATGRTEAAWQITATQPPTTAHPQGIKKRTWVDGAELTLAVVQDPEGKNLVTRFVYDGIGQMVSARDAAVVPHATTVVYDTLGRKVSIDSPDAGLVNFIYDAKGDLVQKVDAVLRAKSLAVTYAYDQHRLLTVHYPDSTVTTIYGSDKSAFNVGRVIETDNGATHTYTSYGPMGETKSVRRVIQSKQALSAPYDNTLSYEYNYLGQMTSVTYPNQEVVSYSYDHGGQVEQIKGDFLGGSTYYARDIGYDEYGQRVLLASGNDTTTVYAYNAQRRWLKSLVTTVDATQAVLQHLEYEFDETGNVLSVTDTLNNRGSSQHYAYDALDQLQHAEGNYYDNTNSVKRVTNYSQNYSYDAIGNMLTKTSSLNRNPTKSEDATLNYSLQYSYGSDKPHQASHIGDSHYVYDANGNLTAIVPDWEWDRYGNARTDNTMIVTTTGPGHDVATGTMGSHRGSGPIATTGTRQMTWDYENRLVSVTQGTMAVQYYYDASGERRLKVQGTDEQVYVDRMYELDRSNGQPTVASVNIYLGQTRLVSKQAVLSDPNFDTQSKNTFYYHPDNLDSSSLISDHLGREYERIAYTPHGEVWQHDTLDSLDKVEQLFTGKGMDKETGWYYFGARYLDPKTGIWLSGDPALGEYIPRAPLTKEDKDANGKLPGMGGLYNPVNFALYHYAGNNPIRYTDPDGKITTAQYNAMKAGGVPYSVLSTLTISSPGLPYEPQKWNDGGKIQLSTNCYAYALDLQKNPITGKDFPQRGQGGFALQPGDLSGNVLQNVDPVIIADFAAKDAASAGRTFKPIGKADTPANGNWKVALVIAPNQDYHWYRQNEDGTWSHKPGSTPVRNDDASGQPILDPETANRGIYTIFVGFFEVGNQ